MLRYATLKYIKPSIIQLSPFFIRSFSQASTSFKSTTTGVQTQSTISTQEHDSRANFYSQFGEVKEHNHPVLYSNNYNISFFGLEKFHPFDSCKYKNIVSHLLDKKTISSEDNLTKVLYKPTDEILKAVHTERYLNSLKSPSTVAKITELPFLAYFPNFLVQYAVLNPMRFATSGSILAGKVAMEKGHAINLGGGYHHCSADHGGGFCPFADITLSIHYLKRHYSQVKNVMIIDLDAHQGNGHERDKLGRSDLNLYILDMYNSSIYPRDHEAKKAIDCPVEVQSGIRDKEYLSLLKIALDKSFRECTPDVVYYNAGTDILEGDPLGSMNITKEGVKKRDELVFQYAKERKIPIVMLLSGMGGPSQHILTVSGGYQRVTAQVIADSIQNLDQKFGIISGGPRP